MIVHISNDSDALFFMNPFLLWFDLRRIDCDKVKNNRFSYCEISILNFNVFLFYFLKEKIKRKSNI